MEAPRPEVRSIVCAHGSQLDEQYLAATESKISNVSFLIEKWEETVRRQDERTRRQALNDDTKRAIMMDMCPPELERHLLLNSDRYDTCAKVKAAIRDYGEQMRHKSDPMEVVEMAGDGDDEYDGEWEEVHAVGKDKNKGKGKGKAKEYPGVGDDAEVAEDLWDLDLCAIDDVCGTCTEQVGAGTLDEYPPGLADLNTFNPWARYCVLQSHVGPDHRAPKHQHDIDATRPNRAQHAGTGAGVLAAYRRTKAPACAAGTRRAQGGLDEHAH